MREVVNRDKNMIFNAVEMLMKFLKDTDRTTREIPLVEYQQRLTAQIPIRPDGNNANEQENSIILSFTKRDEMEHGVTVQQIVNKHAQFYQQFWFTFIEWGWNK